MDLSQEAECVRGFEQFKVIAVVHKEVFGEDSGADGVAEHCEALCPIGGGGVRLSHVETFQTGLRCYDGSCLATARGGVFTHIDAPSACRGPLTAGCGVAVEGYEENGLRGVLAADGVDALHASAERNVVGFRGD